MVAGHLSQKSGRWYLVIELRTLDGIRKPKWISTGLPIRGNKKRSEEMLHQKRVEYTLEQVSRKNAGGILFAEYLVSWLQSRRGEISQATFDSYAFVLKNQVVPYFRAHHFKLAELKATDIAAYYQQMLKKQVSPNTVMRHHAVIHKSLEDAWYRELITSNPAERVRLPRKEAYVSKPYTSDECVQLLQVIKGDRLEIAITMAIFTGMRRGELLGLRWGAIDFTNQLIQISHSVIRGVVDGKLTSVGQNKLKRDSSFRTLPMTEPIKTLLLDEIRIRYGEQSPSLEDYLFVDKNNAIIKPNYLSQAFPKLLKKHGLRHIRLHDLRHSCANLLISGRVPLIEVQQWMGHSSIQTTADMYSHLTFETKLNSAETIKNFNEERRHNMKKSERTTVAELVAEIDSEDLKNVQALLKINALRSLTESDEGCYDAIIQINNEEPLFAEVNLDASSCVEDLHCTCNIGLCIHLATVLHEIKASHASIPCENED